MKNIAVIIRTYSRVDDARALVNIIKHYWKENNYTIYIAFNGKADGYILSKELYDEVEVIEVLQNSGHICGASDLVKQGYEHIKANNNFDYVLFIESDFWLLDEKIINKSILKDKDVSTSIWIEKLKSLGVDCVLIRKEALDKNEKILEWELHAETTFKNLVENAGLSVNIIDEMRSIHVPKTLKTVFPQLTMKYTGEDRRFRIFPMAKAITHHVEDLYMAYHSKQECEKATIEEQFAIGMQIKKSIANALLEEEFFKDAGFHSLSFFEKYVQRYSRYIPQSVWIKNLFTK